MPIPLTRTQRLATDLLLEARRWHGHAFVVRLGRRTIATEADLLELPARDLATVLRRLAAERDRIAAERRRYIAQVAASAPREASRG